MLEIRPPFAAGERRIEIHPLAIGDREIPVRPVFDATPGLAIVLGTRAIGDRFRLVPNEIDVVPPTDPAPAAGRSRLGAP